MAGGIVFEWDRGKEAANWRKHGVGFDEASTVFGDPLSITIADPDHSEDEARFIIIGESDARKLLVVVHSIRRECIRPISARPATARERNDYEEASH